MLSVSLTKKLLSERPHVFAHLDAKIDVIKTLLFTEPLLTHP